MLTAKAVIYELEKLAPPWLAETWDNSGLQVGEYDQEVRGILVALELDEEAVNQALAEGLNLIITHHPFLFQPVRRIDTGKSSGALMAKVIKNDLTVYSAHTNLDAAALGLNQFIAEELNLQNIRPLGTYKKAPLYKLVVFTPATHAEEVREAVAAAGAGHIGRYSDCSFSTSGTGAFRPLEGSHPFIGQKGQLEKVDEVRLETVVPGNLVDQVVKAMLAAHPYEEVAYDLYLLAQEGDKYSMGRIGELPRPVNLETLALLVKERLGLGHLRTAGKLQAEIRRVGVISGSGGSMFKEAAQAGCDVLITGDVKYHEARSALEMGMAIIDAEHDGLEKLMIKQVARYLKDCEERLGWGIPIKQARTEPLFSCF